MDPASEYIGRATLDIIERELSKPEIVAHCREVAERGAGGGAEIKPVSIIPGVKVCHTIVPD